MAETLRELVVALSLNSSNFSHNMRSINQQIKEAESAFRLTCAGVENFEKTVAGTECALSTEPCHHAFDVPTTRDSVLGMFAAKKHNI